MLPGGKGGGGSPPPPCGAPALGGMANEGGIAGGIVPGGGTGGKPGGGMPTESTQKAVSVTLLMLTAHQGLLPLMTGFSHSSRLENVVSLKLLCV